MKHKTNSSVSLFSFLEKIILILGLPFVIPLCLLFALLSFLIDLISLKDDKKHLSYSETRKRKTDRANKRRHSCLSFLMDYFKMMIS